MSGSKGVIGLVGDIGGTNARFALATLSVQGRPRLTAPRTLPCADYPGLVEAVRAYLDEIAAPVPGQAAVAIAGPVPDD